MLTLLFLISCKKDKDTSQAFFAKGYWKGNFFVSPFFENINRPNGNIRLYVRPGNPDTAVAVPMYDSIYTGNGDIFLREFVDAGNSIHGPDFMEGVILFIEPAIPFANAYAFDLSK